MSFLWKWLRVTLVSVPKEHDDMIVMRVTPFTLSTEIESRFLLWSLVMNSNFSLLTLKSINNFKDNIVIHQDIIYTSIIIDYHRLITTFDILFFIIM